MAKKAKADYAKFQSFNNKKNLQKMPKADYQKDSYNKNRLEFNPKI